MIVVKLLSVRIQPVFVLVETDTGDVEPGPQVQPVDFKASQLGELGSMLDGARKQIEEQVQTDAHRNIREGGEQRVNAC